ncbi:hypothetical protein BpHYR1_016178 [Brachionus plicatilis]|uniref:Uncharacterized protein n=1 Tax=Brachionus plicatilis TaxID=10195 RepID=A0A3M7P405_BRAPC|nr:hypothetical protein BpHYR1_016178 [Brachionus plicatilis]
MIFSFFNGYIGLLIVLEQKFSPFYKIAYEKSSLEFFKKFNLLFRKLVLTTLRSVTKTFIL